MRYLIKTNSSADTQTALNDGILGKPYVALVSGSTLDYNGLSPNYSDMPLTLKMLSGGTLTLEGAFGKTSYSINGGDFINIGNGVRVTVDVIYGDKIIFRQINSEYPQGFAKGVPYEAYGNPFYYNNPGSVNSLSYAFDETSVVSAKNLILTEVTDCRSMFQNCTSLTTTPELPATTLAEGCYSHMFYYCTSLTSAPELPATTLASSCYEYMFQGCTRLNYIKCLATDISASSCTTNWVSNVASTGTFVKNPNMTGWTTGNSGIPSGWTVIDAE